MGNTAQSINHQWVWAMSGSNIKSPVMIQLPIESVIIQDAQHISTHSVITAPNMRLELGGVAGARLFDTIANIEAKMAKYHHHQDESIKIKLVVEFDGELTELAQLKFDADMAKMKSQVLTNYLGRPPFTQEKNEE